ncbi:hypothetical protein DW780_04205 [Bacteroides thetaiotaomicron]|jgi:hypothetical protein|uniref:Uncharacterized protein n=1 Tax=Bacteroides thetaiotaomicron TaxID=818 RepID=A0A414HS44_BACT4|nr:hypothetical protein [Bacteroides thetaiotaomicron]RHD90202.1 hypothetical protein DW780_04205 [Bacteroides thetaiotaomicron]
MAENQVKVRPTLTDLEVGKAVTFPIEKTKSVRSQASDLGLILNRKYQTETDREKRIITVIRIS